MSKKKILRNIAIACVLLVLAAGTTKAARSLWIESAPDACRSTSTDDPVEKQVRRETLAIVPDQRQKPAPFQRATNPEPREWSKLVGLKEQSADNDPPVAPPGNPPRPVLLVAPAK